MPIFPDGPSVKAQEADAIANAADSAATREAWERTAMEYRRLAAAAAAIRKHLGKP